ncbi:MAG: HEAT repeat domain-containing protein [Calditerrivibrio sp.]|nr:HEAT repeat domain-containing protein [Calditerrivibrio sp.]
MANINPTENGVVVIKIPGNPEINDFKDARDFINNSQGLKEIRLDLKDVSFLQSKFIAELIAIKKLSTLKNSKLILTNVQEGVFQMLEISNLIDHFSIGKDFRSYEPNELIYLLMDPELNDSVIEFIANNFDDTFRNLIAEFLKSEDPILIEAAVMIIGKSHSFDMVEEVKKCLTSPFPNVVRGAILVLGWFGEEDCKGEIYQFLKSEHIDVAEAAAATISLLADENDSIAIKEYLESPDERLRRIAIQALSLINDDFSYKFLLEHLGREKDEQLRTQLAKAISYYNKPEVPGILLSMLSENSIKIREAAASSLVRIKATDKIDDILELVSDKDVWVAYFAVKAVGALCKSQKCVDVLVKNYPKVDTQVKIAIIEALGNIGLDCSEFIFQLVEDENEDIRKEALNSLALINSDMAAEAAYNALNDKIWVVRFKAIEIIEDKKPADYKDKLKDFLKTETNRYVREKIQSIVGEL